MPARSSKNRHIRLETNKQSKDVFVQLNIFVSSILLALPYTTLAHDGRMIDRKALFACAIAHRSSAHEPSMEASVDAAKAAPKLFAPEAEWPAGTDVSPAFTPDGQTVFFTHAAGAARTIMSPTCGITLGRNLKWRPFLAPGATLNRLWRQMDLISSSSQTDLRRRAASR
jgi:hypothetical protein